MNNTPAPDVRPTSAAFILQIASSADGRPKFSLASFGEDLPKFDEEWLDGSQADVLDIKPESLLQGLTLIGPMILAALKRDNFDGVEMVGYEVEAQKLLNEIDEPG